MRRTWTGLAAAVLMGGCSTETSTTFVLARVGTDTVPFVLRDRDEYGCRHILKGAEVVFGTASEYRSTFTIERICATSGEPLIDELGSAGRVEMQGDSAVFMSEGGNREGIGLIASDSLVVQGPLHRLTYRRQ